VTSSISRRLIFWLTVPLMIMALCGSLVHYFNNIAPGVISSDRRLKDAANSLMTHVLVKDGSVTLENNPEGKPPLPSADSIKFALRDLQGHLIAGDAQLPVIPMSDATSQLLSMSQVDQRSLRTLTTRFDTRAGVILITVADIHPPSEPAVRYGFMSTLLWDFVQLDVTLVLVWIGIQLGLRPVRKLRDEIAQRSPLDLRPIVDSTVPREIAPVVVTLNRLFATLRTAAQSQQQFIANTAHQLRTPITGMQARKLGLKPGQRVALDDPPPGWVFADPPGGLELTGEAGAADLIVAFFARAADLGLRLPGLAERIFPDGAVWAAWPRRAGGHTSDITDNVVREYALPLGLVDVKVAAIDDDWSGLRLCWRRENRGPRPPAS